MASEEQIGGNKNKKLLTSQLGALRLGWALKYVIMSRTEANTFPRRAVIPSSEQKLEEALKQEKGAEGINRQT